MSTLPAFPKLPSQNTYPTSVNSNIDATASQGLTQSKYRVVLAQSKCIGAASCVAVASKGFHLNDHQIVELLPTLSAELDDNVLLAAQSCPVLAIEIYDAQTGDKIWPK